MPETGSRPQAVLQPLQASQKAQQTDSVCRGTYPGAEVGVWGLIFMCHTCTHRTLQLASQSAGRRNKDRGMMAESTLLPSPCVSTLMLPFRYEDAVNKYEAVMKTEPNVQHFSVLAKERICHALTQVRPSAPGGPDQGLS